MDPTPVVYNPPPGSIPPRDPTPPPPEPQKRAVCIILECFLVLIVINIYKIVRAYFHFSFSSWCPFHIKFFTQTKLRVHSKQRTPFWWVLMTHTFQSRLPGDDARVSVVPPLSTLSALQKLRATICPAHGYHSCYMPTATSCPSYENIFSRTMFKMNRNYFSRVPRSSFFSNNHRKILGLERSMGVFTSQSNRMIDSLLQFNCLEWRMFQKPWCRWLRILRTLNHFRGNAIRSIDTSTNLSHVISNVSPPRLISDVRAHLQFWHQILPCFFSNCPAGH